MSIFERVLSCISLVCFGFCLCLFAVSIDMGMGWYTTLWSVVMLIWHGCFGWLGVYDFIRRKKE